MKATVLYFVSNLSQVHQNHTVYIWTRLCLSEEKHVSQFKCATE